MANTPVTEGTLRAALQACDALYRDGRLDEAMAGYASAGRAFPGEAEPRFRVGLIQAQRGELRAAMETLELAVAMAERPHYLFALGDVLERLGTRADAIAAWRRAVALNPGLAAAHARLGIALQEAGRWDEAIGHLRLAVQLRPGEARSLNNLAVALTVRGQPADAEFALRQVLALDPGHPSAHGNLARALIAQGREAEARPALEQAVRIDPGNAQAWEMLGAVLLHLGLAEEAVGAFGRAEAREPANAAQVGSRRLFALHCSGRHGRDEVFAAHREWAGKYAPRRSPVRAFRNSPDPARRLRVGYLSPRFHRASVAFLHVPVFECHDRNAYEIHCYAEQDIEDDVTKRIRASGVAWTCTRGLSDQALAARLQEDGVDIAIDLAGHTPGHRLTMLPYQPAPLVGTWLDYFDTTGMEGVDFLITDPVHSPPGDGQKFTERLVRLPHCRFCWEPPAYAPAAMPPPLTTGGAPVFGAFVRMAKISPATADAWCELLRRIPRARLVIKNSALARNEERRIFAKWFEDRNIDPCRVEWRGSTDHATMLAEYNDIDVVLDTFPYNGGLTTLEALWMGRPVVAMDGDALISRQSKAILSAIGMTGLCAPDTPGYIAIAESLVNDPHRLAAISRDLREQLRASALLDSAGFTRDLEALLRDEWSRWCAGSR